MSEKLCQHSDVIEKLKERYSHVFPLIFSRSVEYASSLGELFDVMEEIPQDYPLFWDQSKRRWASVKDVFMRL